VEVLNRKAPVHDFNALSLLIVIAVAVLAPLLAEIPIGLRVPTVVSRSCWASVSARMP
jgi:hypothetical protein